MVAAGCRGPAAEHAADPRTFTSVEGFHEGYWQRPIPPQGGDAARGEALHPERCGTCHALQYADWRSTLHAGAYSPGLEGQLVEWERDDYPAVRECLDCHAPLTEQSVRIPDPGDGRLVENRTHDAALQRQGIVCAACHLRGGRAHGPPVRPGRTPPGTDAPHGLVARSPYFEDPAFCAGCHQFAEPAVNGKPLQNTLVEWRESRYARTGVSCQGCHMPDRRHLWRGIHDSTMTRNGVTIALDRSHPNEVRLRVTNSGTGHRFPTYVTAKVLVRIEQRDAAGRTIPGATREGAIGRVVRATSTGWVEDADTRIIPDSTFQLAARLQPEAASVRAAVTVFPDGFYQGVFASLLTGRRSDTARALLTRALQRAGSSSFLIFDEVMTLPATGDW